jgi:hypothetical protein
MKWNSFMRCAAATTNRLPARERVVLATPKPKTTPGLLLPGAFFVAIGAQLFAAFMFVNLAFATFL